MNLKLRVHLNVNKTSDPTSAIDVNGKVKV